MMSLMTDESDSAIPGLPAILTHLEIADLLGSARTRERWEQEGLLPAPRWVTGFGKRIGLYPSVVLARIVSGRVGGSAEGAVRDLMDRCGDLLESALFDQAVEILSMQISQLKSVRLSADLLERLVDANLLAPLIDANAHVASLQAKSGITFQTVLGKLLREDGEHVVVEEAFGPRVFDRASLLGAVEVGEAVMVESVRVGSREHDYVVPAIPSAQGSAVPTGPDGLTDADWNEAFAGLTVAPRMVAAVSRPASAYASLDGEIVRPTGSIRITAPREIYLSANPMSRAPLDAG